MPDNAFVIHRRYTVQRNIGNVDRLLRVTVGLALIGATLMQLVGAWGWIGVVPLLTGAVQVCPAYLPFGLSTRKRPNR